MRSAADASMPVRPTNISNTSCRGAKLVSATSRRITPEMRNRRGRITGDADIQLRDRRGFLRGGGGFTLGPQPGGVLGRCIPRIRIGLRLRSCVDTQTELDGHLSAVLEPMHATMVARAYCPRCRWCAPSTTR